MYVLDDPVCKVHFKLLAIFAYMSCSKFYHRVIVIPTSVLILSISIIFQAALFITRDLEARIVIEVVPILGLKIVCLLFLVVNYVNRKTYDKLLEMFENDSVQQRTKEEEEIMDSFKATSQTLVTFLTALTILGSHAIVVSAYIPKFLDLLLPLNESRQLELPYAGEYFVDEQEYFHIILFTQYITMIVIIVIVGPAEMVFFLLVYHICGQIALTAYHLEHVAQRIDYDNDREKIEQYEQRIISAVAVSNHSYQVVLQYMSLLERATNFLLLVLMLLTVFIFSISLVAVINPKAVDLKTTLFTFAQITQFFFINYLGQLILNESSELQGKAYATDWYYCPSRLQKLCMMLMLVCRKPCELNACNLYAFSLKNFLSITQTAISYCMVLRQC